MNSRMRSFASSTSLNIPSSLEVKAAPHSVRNRLNMPVNKGWRGSKVQTETFKEI